MGSQVGGISTALAEAIGQEARQADSEDLLPGDGHIICNTHELDRVEFGVTYGKTGTWVTISGLTHRK